MQIHRGEVGDYSFMSVAKHHQRSPLMEPDRVTYSSSACRDVRSWLMMLYVLSALSVYPNAHKPNWFGKVRWRGSRWERCRRIRGVGGKIGELTNWRIDPREVEELKNKKKEKRRYEEQVEIHRGGGIKQNTLRQGFCLLSFNFNCLFFFKPRVFQLLSATPVKYYTV